jgi:hypothetical protein
LFRSNSLQRKANFLANFLASDSFSLPPPAAPGASQICGWRNSSRCGE